MVCVSPGMFDTKVIVAPNSPRLLAKARIVPVSIPGKDSGIVMVKKTIIRLAPKVLAATSKPRSIVSNDSLTARTISGNAITAEAIAAPFQVKATVISKVS